MAGMMLEQAWPSVFTQAEAQLLTRSMDPPRGFRPRQQILRRDTGVSRVHYLSSGFVAQYRVDHLGRRQALGIQVPGDFLDLPGLVLSRLEEESDALGAAELRSLPLARLKALETGAPEVPEKLWRIALIDAAINRYWIYRIGRLGGRARIANFFCEMLLRLYARGLGRIDHFDLPLTQTDLAEACGMTAVHVNRMMAELREEGVCTFTQGTVKVSKLPELFQMGQFRWDYLHLPAELDREIRDRVAPARPASLRGGAAPRPDGSRRLPV